MNRSVVTTILVGSLVFLAALLGLLGYRVYKNVYVPMTHKVVTLPPMMIMPPSGPDVTESLKKTFGGVVSEVTVKNSSKEELIEVDVTQLQYDTFKAKGLPAIARKIGPGKSLVLTIPIPGLKTLSTSYTSLAYKYQSKSGNGSSLSSSGIPPTPPASSASRGRASRVVHT